MIGETVTISCELIRKRVKNMRERERERVENKWMMCLLMWFNKSVAIINTTLVAFRYR